MGKTLVSAGVSRLFGRHSLFCCCPTVVPHLHAKSGQVENRNQLPAHDDGAGRHAQHPPRAWPLAWCTEELSLWQRTESRRRVALSLGIAIREFFPEGGDHFAPAARRAWAKQRAFWGGVLSGIVEPIGAVLTILAASLIVPALPYLLSFAAGAMLDVVVWDPPEMSQRAIQHRNGVFRRELQPDDGARRGAGRNAKQGGDTGRYASCFLLTPALRLFFHRMRLLSAAACRRKHFVVKILLPVDVGDAVLQFPNACAQCLLLLRQQRSLRCGMKLRSRAGEGGR